MIDYNTGHALVKKCVRIKTKNNKKLKKLADFYNVSESLLVDRLIERYQIIKI